MSMSLYQGARDISWTVETTGLLLMRPGSGVCCRLAYPEAAIWDFVTRGYDLQRVARMIRHIGGFPDDSAAEKYVRDRLRSWLEAGFLVVNKSTNIHV